MSDDVDKPDTSDSEPQGPRGGELLAEARREQQIHTRVRADSREAAHPDIGLPAPALAGAIPSGW